MNKIFDVIWKSLVTGAVYVLAAMVAGAIMRALDLSAPAAGNATAMLLWLFAGGVVAALFLGPVAASMAASRLRHVVVWGSILLFNLVSVIIEGYFFAPDQIGNSLTGLILQEIVVAAITGWIITILFAPKQAEAAVAPARRSFVSWLWRFLVTAFSYFVFYFIFGAINYQLVTRPYYMSHAGGLTVPAANVVFRAELVRGVLIALSVLPFLLTFRAEKKRLVVLTGLILFGIGGLIPLSMQATRLPALLLIASAVEIFFQNFSTGAVAALLLGTPRGAEAHVANAAPQGAGLNS